MTEGRTAIRDAGIAILLAIVLGVAWTMRDWTALSALRLPDTDDVVRLQQVRDWLGGQRFDDLAQHRLGLGPGVEMHWSRLADLLPAALILALSPLAAVIVAPLLLFAVALVLVTSIARQLAISGATAAVVAALAYPASTLFVPGRIDHHGLQMVLLLIVVRAAVGAGTAGWGVAAGVASAASLAVGVETAPLLAIGGAGIVSAWVVGADGAGRRLGEYGAALGVTLALAAVFLRTGGWGYPACDGFTAQLWRGAQLAAVAPLVLAAARALVPGRQRLVAAGVAAVVAGGGALLLAPACLHPYAAVDPFLARVWLANVAEAQPLLRAPAGEAIGYAGVTIAGVLAGAVVAWRRGGGWTILLAVQCGALALTVVQLRGAYAGALLAAPALAAMIGAARARGGVALLPAWIVSAGLLYPMLGKAVGGAQRGPAADCSAPRLFARLAAMPRGTVLAPIDMGARALAETPHRVVAAPYHRNGAGNLFAYRFFLRADRAPTTVAGGPVYVLWCGTPTAALGIPAPRGSLAAALAGNRAPAWLTPVAHDGAMRLYRLTPQH